jgi:hypothetical protein
MHAAILVSGSSFLRSSDTLSLVNHQTAQQIKLELIDPAFPARTYRVRIHPGR